MKRITRKIMLIFIMLLIVLTLSSFGKVYANSDAEELVEVLDMYKSELGDLEQFQSVINQVYNDLNSATKVDDSLKNTLIADINKLSEVEGMNPLILQVLVEELTSQVNNLTDETLPEMKEEIQIIKAWADEQVSTGETETPPVEETPEEETPQTPSTTTKPSTQTPTDTSLSDKNIPYAGIRDMFVILILVAVVVAIIAKKKYKNLNGI